MIESTIIEREELVYDENKLDQVEVGGEKYQAEGV